VPERNRAVEHLTGRNASPLQNHAVQIRA